MDELVRYVILGNHRDAWTFGAVDPNSGTAVLLEASKVFLNMYMLKSYKFVSL